MSASWRTGEKYAKGSVWQQDTIVTGCPLDFSVFLSLLGLKQQSCFCSRTLSRPQSTLVILKWFSQRPFLIRTLFGFYAKTSQDSQWMWWRCWESQAIWMSQWVLRMKWEQSLKVSWWWVVVSWHEISKERVERQGADHCQCLLWGAQGMRLAYKYGMDPGAEWEAVWVVSSLLIHYDSQSSVVLEEASCFGQVIFSMPDSGTWVFRS